MNVDQVHDFPNLATEVSLIQDALDRGISILGICLWVHNCWHAPSVHQ